MSNPNTTGYSSAEVKAGLVLTLCLALFVGMLFFYGKMARFWYGRQEISVLFTSVTSLRPDAPVRLNGVEVGRVKEIGILHLADENFTRLPALRAADLENLPLTEKEQKDLRALPPDKFDAALKDTIKTRTMIHLVLEVLSERDPKRFRIDDQVRINTTLMGDTWVDISSGSSPLVPADDRLMLGVSGDFFSNLAKSVEQVKEILGSVSDVVGPDERDSVRKSLRRLDAISARVEKIVTLVDDRLPKTWTKVDSLADDARTNLNKISGAITDLQPQLTRTLSTAEDAVKDLQDRVGKLTDESKSAVVDVKGQVKPILADLQYITSKSKEDFPVMVKNTKDLAARLQESAGKLDNVLTTSDRLLTDSYPDLRRLILALRMGAENFEEATNVLKRKPWLLVNPAKGDASLDNGQKTARDLELATKRFAELSIELQAVRRNMDQAPKEKLERIDFMLQELNVLSETLKFAGDMARKDVLPPFERKKTGFVAVPPEPFNPDLKGRTDAGGK